MKYLKLLFTLCFFQQVSAVNLNSGFVTVFEKTNSSETATYQQTIDFYHGLAMVYPEISIQTIGKTDSGKPLHIVIYNTDDEQDFDTIRKTKTILLINNGIHPGESDGIDATMLLFRDLIEYRITKPENVVIVTIPIYNIGGALNRNSTTRTNQNGPINYGFRGNARNYDLNRDFIKSDTLNAKTFAEIFHLVRPDVFIDNHVSNGADYQYTLTHLFTQHNKLGGELGDYLHTVLMPKLEYELNRENLDITPYVNVFNKTPESGFSQFIDYPRYSTGYTTLFNTLGMMVETHMLKPYKQRVEGTYKLIVAMIAIMDKESDKIKQLRKDYHKTIYAQEKYALDWKIDQSKSSTLNFKGYAGTMIDSKVTNAQRLKYNRNKPFTKPVKYQNHFKPSIEITIPKAYIIPQGWHKVIAQLKLNQVAMQQISVNSSYQVESLKIADYETKKTPYEGHYMHSKTQVTSTHKNIEFRKGDYIIQVNQPSIRYIIETLEPQTPDSFFNWNFFDTILQQKEHFSPYVFEDIAEQLFKDKPELKQKFEQKLKEEKSFRENWYTQLDWVHKHSKHYEKAHLQYPVYRLLK